MNTEQIKTCLWVAVALILAVGAFVNLPAPIELESQARVNEPLFADYQASSVWAIEIQKPPSVDFRRRRPGANVDQLTVKRTANRGWELLEFQSFPAENSQLIGQLSTALSDLKVLEVISENATDAELGQYGLLAPEGLTQELSPEEATQFAVRLKLSDANQSVVGDLLIGKVVPQQGQGTTTAYVRPTTDSSIYRVAINKEFLSTNLADWVNPNPLGLQAPAGIPALAPATRIAERIQVSTAVGGRPESDPYRAEFRMGESVALLKLETATDGQWTEIPPQRLPASAEFTQNWRLGLQVVPAFLVLSDVQVKSGGLRQDLRRGEIRPNMDISELTPLGFQIEPWPDGPTLTGVSGTMLVQAQGGLRFHFALGQPNAAELLPVVVYVSLDPAAIRPRPELRTLPAEAVDWAEDRRAQELETLQRDHTRRVEEWTAANRQLNQEVAMLNEQLAPWIYYLPTRYVFQAIPNIRLSRQSVAPAESPAELPAESQAESQAQPVEGNGR